MKNEKSLPLHAQDFCEFTEDLIRRLQDYLDSGLFMDDPGIMKGFHAEYVFVFYVPGNDKPIFSSCRYADSGVNLPRKISLEGSGL